MAQIKRRYFIKSIGLFFISIFLSFFFYTYARKNKKNRISFIQRNNGSINENELSAVKTGRFKNGFEPSYIKLHQTGELKRRGEELWTMMERCRLCPRICNKNRLEGQEGFCNASSRFLSSIEIFPNQTILILVKKGLFQAKEVQVLSFLLIAGYNVFFVLIGKSALEAEELSAVLKIWQT